MCMHWAAPMPSPMCWALRGPPGPSDGGPRGSRTWGRAGMGATHCMRIGMYIGIYKYI